MPHLMLSRKNIFRRTPFKRYYFSCKSESKTFSAPELLGKQGVLCSYYNDKRYKNYSGIKYMLKVVRNKNIVHIALQNDEATLV